MRSQSGDLAAAEPHAARSGWDDTGDEVEQCRLAGAVGSNDRAHLAFLDVHGHAVDGHERAIALGQVIDLEQRLSHGAPRWARGRARTHAEPIPRYLLARTVRRR